MTMFAARVAGGLDSWTPLYLLVAGFLVIVAVVDLVGPAGSHRSSAGRHLLRIPNGLERVTGIPGWAAATLGTALFGLLVAGVGFYSDVAWHVYTGRDKNLFTAPHTMIILGLFLIAGAALLGILFASLSDVDTTIRWRALRVPWSTVPLGLLGASAVCGFPLDDLWHVRYGIDVTMWSPTHLLMILGASFSPLAAWLVLAEAGVRPRDGRWPAIAHTLAAIMTLEGLSSAQGEFRFGVPQFQQLYLPVLICLAAAFTLVATRLVLGRARALLVATLAFLTTFLAGANRVNGTGFVHPRPTAVYVASALVVELVALVVGVERRLRFAMLSAVGVATIGLAGEWWWNSAAIQPWHRALLPGAVLVGGLAALGAAVLGAAFGQAVDGRPSGFGGPVLALAALTCIVALLIPLPRRVGHVTAQISLARRGDRAVVTAVLTPAGAADHARWFQTLAWQGGGLVVSGMHRAAPGTWVSDEAVPVAGKWKTVLRLQRGDQLMAVPIWFPPDLTIPAPEIAAVDRSASFVNERHYLLREQTGPADWFSILVEGLVVAVGAAWAWGVVVAARRIRGAGITARSRRLASARSLRTV